MVSFNASAVSAEVAICMALKPWWARRSAPWRPTRSAGRPLLVTGLHSSAIWRSSRSARLATAAFSPSIDDGRRARRRSCRRAAPSSSPSTMGLSLTLLISISSVGRDIEQRIHQHADDVRGAAQGIAILDAPGLRGLVERQLDVLADPARAASAARGAASARTAGRSKWARLPAQDVARHGGQRRGEPGQLRRPLERQAGQPGHHAGAVHHRQALLGRRAPSGLMPDLGQRRARGHHPAPEPGLALAHHAWPRRTTAA